MLYLGIFCIHLHKQWTGTCNTHCLHWGLFKLWTSLSFYFSTPQELCSAMKTLVRNVFAMFAINNLSLNLGKERDKLRSQCSFYLCFKASPHAKIQAKHIFILWMFRMKTHFIVEIMGDTGITLTAVLHLWIISLDRYSSWCNMSLLHSQLHHFSMLWCMKLLLGKWCF